MFGFTGHVPSVSFILWLAVLDWLATKFRLQTWGCLQGSTSCEFCSLEDESRYHLFFACLATKGIWGAVAGKLMSQDLLGAGQKNLLSLQVREKKTGSYPQSYAR